MKMNNADYIELAGCRSILSKIDANHGIVKSPWNIKSSNKNMKAVREFLDFYIKGIEHIIEDEKTK